MAVQRVISLFLSTRKHLTLPFIKKAKHRLVKRVSPANTETSRLQLCRVYASPILLLLLWWTNVEICLWLARFWDVGRKKCIQITDRVIWESKTWNRERFIKTIKMHFRVYYVIVIWLLHWMGRIVHEKDLLEWNWEYLSEKHCRRKWMKPASDCINFWALVQSRYFCFHIRELLYLLT
jgi:hypothetical protein